MGRNGDARNCAERGNQRFPVTFGMERRAGVPTGRDGEEEQGDFASFPALANETADEPLTCPPACRIPSGRGHDDGAAPGGDDRVLVLHGGRLGFGPEGEAIPGFGIDSMAGAER